MILKWLSSAGNWHLMDGITDVTHHGYLSEKEIHKLADIYDGLDTSLDRRVDAADFGNMPANWDYLVVKRRGERHHLLLYCDQIYVLSDDGKTIDRFRH